MSRTQPHTISFTQKIRRLKASEPSNLQIARDIIVEEITAVISTIKTGKAAGLDEIYPGFVKHFEPNTINWLTV